MQTINSKDVAEMLGKRHDNFMRDLRKYISTLGEEAPKYFIEEGSSGVSRSRAGYAITLDGCDLIAGRMIGAKGKSFRDKYMEVFAASEDKPVADPVSTDLTVEEVAKRLGCSERNVYRMIKAGKLVALQKEILIPVTKIFVTVDALEQCIAERRGV